MTVFEFSQMVSYNISSKLSILHLWNGNILSSLTRSLWYGILILAFGRHSSLGEMSEWFKEPVLKTGDSKEPWVRIPLSPPALYLSVLEKYPSGRRGSPAKGVVRVERSEGSNPSFSAN